MDVSCQEIFWLVKANCEKQALLEASMFQTYFTFEIKKPKCVSKAMVKHWDEDDKFKKLSAQNKKNRMSDLEGLGPSLYTCRSISMSGRKMGLISYELIAK